MALSSLFLAFGVASALDKKLPYAIHIINAIFAVTFAYFCFIVVDINIRIVLISLIAIANFTALILITDKKTQTKIDPKLVLPLKITAYALILAQVLRIFGLMISADNEYLNHTLIDTIASTATVALNIILITVIIVLFYGLSQKKVFDMQLEIESKKIKEQILYESEKKYRQLFETLPLGMATHTLIFDEKGKAIDYTFDTVNHTFELQTGLNKEDIIGKRVFTVLPQNEQYWLDTYAKVCSSQTTINFIEEYKSPNRTFFVSAYPVDNQHLAAIFMDITEQLRQKEEVKFLQTHDKLTELYNRAALTEDLKNIALQSDSIFSLIMFDINSFGLFNDVYDFSVGDSILKQVASATKSVVGQKDKVYRVGHDEYVILLYGQDLEKAKSVITILKEKVEAIHHEELYVSITYAVSQYESQNSNYEKILQETENDLNTYKVFRAGSHRNKSINVILSMLLTKYEDEKRHSLEVSRYCVEVGKALNLDENSLAQLNTIGSIHDIGKIAIPEAILHKPARLTDEEYTIMKTHSEIGYNILKSTTEFITIAPIVLHHHERWDGNGYPSKLKGEDIPLFSRIISVADAYEAMTSDRVYRPKKSKESAVAELLRCRGTQFDPTIVDLFITLI